MGRWISVLFLALVSVPGVRAGGFVLEPGIRLEGAHVLAGEWQAPRVSPWGSYGSTPGGEAVLVVETSFNRRVREARSRDGLRFGRLERPGGVDPRAVPTPRGDARRFQIDPVSNVIRSEVRGHMGGWRREAGIRYVPAQDGHVSHLNAYRREGGIGLFSLVREGPGGPAGIFHLVSDDGGWLFRRAPTPSLPREDYRAMTCRIRPDGLMELYLLKGREGSRSDAPYRIDSLVVDPPTGEIVLPVSPCLSLTRAAGRPLAGLSSITAVGTPDGRTRLYITARIRRYNQIEREVVLSAIGRQRILSVARRPDPFSR